MDPLTAALNLLTSVNTVINTLASKASTPVADALIQDYLARQARVEAVVQFVANKFGLSIPSAPPLPVLPAPAPNVAPAPVAAH